MRQSCCAWKKHTDSKPRKPVFVKNPLGRKPTAKAAIGAGNGPLFHVAGKQQLLGKGTAFRECEVIVPHIQPRLQQEIPPKSPFTLESFPRSKLRFGASSRAVSVHSADLKIWP